MRRILVALVLAVSGVAGDAASQTPTFARIDVPSVAGARAIAAADFDRNGWQDLAHANIARNTVAIVLASPSEGLVRRGEIAVGAGPFDLAQGDFNRDAVPDLAVANADGHSISILLGRGDGSFRRTDIPTPAQGPRGITAADIDNDGRVDLVYTGYLTGHVRVLFGDGTGGFADSGTPAAIVTRAQGVAAADFDADGSRDLAVAGASGLWLLYGTGPGGGAFVARLVPAVRELNVVHVSDLDADGRPDVAAASSGGSRLLVYRSGVSGAAQAVAYPTGLSPRGIAAADLNGDGLPDLITANRGSSTVTVLAANPASRGTFLPALHLPAGAGSRAVAAADFDADGSPDLASGNEYAASVTLLTNTMVLPRAGRSFGTLDIASDVPLVSTGALATADFDLDGRLDVATRGGAGGGDGVAVLLARGGTVSLPGPHPFAGFLVADVDPGGRADVVYIASDSSDLGGGIHARVITFLNAAGGFTPSPETTSTLWLRRCAAGDMNRDARVDLACLAADDASHVLHVLLGRGNGTFRAGMTVPLSAPGVDLQLADVDRDGALDVAVLAASVEIWRGDGAGGLARHGQPVPAAVADPAALRLADVNHDARLDLAVTGSGGELAIRLGTADAFGEAATSTWPAAGGMLDVADVNRDGAPDLIVSGQPGLVFRGVGNGTFETPGSVAFFGPFAVADVTNDGLPDVVSHFRGGVRVLVNTRADINRPPVVTAPDRTLEYWQIVVDPLVEQDCPFLSAEASDPDQDAVRFEWRDSSGRVVSIDPFVFTCTTQHGIYPYQLTVSDGRGGVVTRTVTLTIRPGKELVLYAIVPPGVEQEVWLEGGWAQVSDPSGAAGLRAHHPDRGAPKVTAPLAAPVDTIRIRFTPDPTQTYKLWVRLKAERDFYDNDSIWVQFSGATDVSGKPAYRIGTASALPVNLEECAGCGLSGWGWEDDGWGAVDRNGVLLRFPDGGRQDILIQTREDGVSVDQVLFSAEQYLTTRPGSARGDNTVYPRTYTENPH